MVEFTGSNGSGVDTSVYGSTLTKVLNKIAPGQGADAYQLAQLLTPAPREISGAELALQFFSNMAANASQPGATVLSSAASAVKPTADEYIRQVEANRKSREATGPLAVSLAKALKPAKATQPTIGGYTLVKDIEGVGKAGDPLTMSNAEAAKFTGIHGFDSLQKYTPPSTQIDLGKGDESQYAKTVGTKAANAFIDNQAASKSAYGTLTDLDTMFEMISEMDEGGEITDSMLETGAIANLTLPLKNLAVSLNIGGVNLNDEVSSATALNSLVNKVTLGTVAQLKGPLSEKELGFLAAVQPYLGNTVDGNKLIILIQKHAAEKAVNYDKFLSEWRNKKIEGKDGILTSRGNPKSSSEFDNMIEDWRATDEFRMPLTKYIGNLTKDFTNLLIQKDLQRVAEGKPRKYEVDDNGFTAEGAKNIALDVNKRIPRTTLNKLFRDNTNIQELFNKVLKELGD